ncbi:MAG TPA: type II secretion system protein GspJ [Sedimentisphaerales bacterium]|nr:type II secretion system protein GspJ [Sedimentisphaerales bacterium]HRS12070.1 type II secretion system protein GspJ [Sedimentisphaerales bacterium]HRV48497.1 type II secretion system protein GspJ [Sedimentisphaerales bacterium]
MAAVRNRGFTLAEILVASTISTFIAVVAVGALKTVSDTAQTVTRSSETVTEVRFAARMLAHDLANIYRDQDPRAMRLVGTSQSADSAIAFLRFYVTGRANARPGQPEGDVYEVEYFLGMNAALEIESEDQAGSSTLYRRLWPNPEENRPPGGILVPLAQNIDVFQIRFSDGQQWTTDWPEEMRSLPQLIEVTLVTSAQGQGNPIVETFLVNFPRLATAADAASAIGSNQPGGQNQMPQGGGPPAPR